MMKKYSKIGKVSTAVKTLIMKHQFQGLDDDGNPIYDKNADLPTITLYGTIKLHGTNASVTQFPDKSLQFQSRENVITPEKDNAGFAFWASNHKAMLELIIEYYRDAYQINRGDSVVVYGEWAGKGIQKGVGISELDKAFYIFDIAVIPEEGGLEENYYLPMHMMQHASDPEVGIYNLWDTTKFPTYKVEMDLENPKLVQNDLIKYTDDVEEQCPVAKYFGVEGVGEGVVWRDASREFICKIKGDKHAGKSKVRKTNIVDVEKLNSVNEFVERFVDKERLEQGWGKMIELGFDHHQKHTGDFVRWMINDIISEESDTLAESKLEPKDVNPSIGKASSKWFLAKLDEL